MVNYVLRSLDSRRKISSYLFIDHTKSSTNGATVGEPHLLLLVVIVDKEPHTESFCALVSSSDETSRCLELSETDGPEPSMPDFIPASSAASFLT